MTSDPPDGARTVDSQVVIVTGTGSGIGEATALALATAGHHVYAGLRDTKDRNAHRVLRWRDLAQRAQLDVIPIELDVTSEASCQAAVDLVLTTRGRLDVVVNNAGTLMTGIAESFTPEQFLQILDTNAVSWLRVNRAALPVMRRQGSGTLVYISSTTVHLNEPFLGLYTASKAAGEALAEVMAFETGQVGIDTVIVVPGAFVEGTAHFTNSDGGKQLTVESEYGDLAARAGMLPVAVRRIDPADNGPLPVSAVAGAVRDVLAMPRRHRPLRIVVDGQHKGVEQLDTVRDGLRRAFFEQMGIADLLPTT